MGVQLEVIGIGGRTVRRCLQSTIHMVAVAVVLSAGIIQPVFAASSTPYSWLKNIGTSGCPDSVFNPYGITIVGSNVYVSSSYSVHTLTVGGMSVGQFGVQGSNDGQFLSPRGVALDSTGDIYVTDMTNHRIQIFNPDGTYKSQFGSLGSGNGQFNNPQGIAFSSAGDIYVTDMTNHRIQIFNPDGTYKSQFGSMGSGNGQFNRPHSIVFSSTGDIYVSDMNNYRIQIFNPDGSYKAQFGSVGSGNGQFNNPQGIALNGAGDIYVTDAVSQRVQVFNPDGSYKAQFGSLGSGNGQFNRPRNIAFSSTGDIYVSDTDNHRIQIFNPDGSYKSQMSYADPVASTPDNLCAPSGISRDGAGNVYVSDTTWGNVKVYTSDGVLLRLIGTLGSGGGSQLVSPRDVSVAPDGTVYVADGLRVAEFTSTGQFVQSIPTNIANNVYTESTNVYATADALYVSSYMSVFVSSVGYYEHYGFLARYDLSGTQQWIKVDFPSNGIGADNRYSGLAMNAAGNLVAMYRGTDTVHSIDPATGDVLSGGYGTNGSGDSQFRSSLGLSIDASGNTFVADTNNDRVQVFDAAGNYVTQFGTTGASSGQLDRPKDIMVAPDGIAYVVDSVNRRISVWAPAVIPSIPQSLVYVISSPQEATISWTPPASVGVFPYTYTVMYRTLGASTWTTLTDNLASSQTSYQLTGLEVGASYEIRVLAVNAFGTSPAATYTFTTDGVLAETGASAYLVAAGAVASLIAGLFLGSWRYRRTPHHAT